jgi:uncharacterized protein YjbI with pentapeptide repeats
MSVFMHLADFRGCKMTSLRLDYADIRGDMLLVNAQIAPGDLSLVQASLRGANNDFRGLHVGGRLDLQGAQIANLQLQWYENPTRVAAQLAGQRCAAPVAIAAGGIEEGR